MRSRMDPHYIIHNLYFMYMIWSTKNKPFRDCSLWYRGCYAIGWAIEGCPGKGILDNPHIFLSHFEPYISEDIPIYSRCSWGSQFTKWDAPPSWRPVAFQDGSADFSERCCWFVYLYLIDVIWTLQPNFWYPMLIDKSSNFDFLHVR